MTHLPEETLHEYLDNALSPQARAAADAHLQDCAACQVELETLRSLFAEIESLPEAPLERDLSPVIVAALGSRTAVPRVVWGALVAQALALVVLLGLAWPLIDLPIVTLPDLPSASQLLAQWTTQQDALLRALGQVSLPSFSIPFSPPFDPPVILLILTFLGACLFWLVGNGLLLRPGQTISLKRRDS